MKKLFGFPSIALVARFLESSEDDDTSRIDSGSKMKCYIISHSCRYILPTYSIDIICIIKSLQIPTLEQNIYPIVAFSNGILSKFNSHFPSLGIHSMDLHFSYWTHLSIHFAMLVAYMSPNVP